MKTIAAVIGHAARGHQDGPGHPRASARRRAVALRVCVTGQHREMLDQVLDVVRLDARRRPRPDAPDQTLAGAHRAAIAALDALRSRRASPTWSSSRGTPPPPSAARSPRFYAGVPVGHVEAGLRTGDRGPLPGGGQPGPDRAAWPTLHFAPTEGCPRATCSARGSPPTPSWSPATRRSTPCSWTSPAAGPTAGAAGPPRRPLGRHDGSMVLITAPPRELRGAVPRPLRAIRELAGGSPRGGSSTRSTSTPTSGARLPSWHDRPRWATSISSSRWRLLEFVGR